MNERQELQWNYYSTFIQLQKENIAPRTKRNCIWMQDIRLTYVSPSASFSDSNKQVEFSLKNVLSLTVVPPNEMLAHKSNKKKYMTEAEKHHESLAKDDKKEWEKRRTFHVDSLEQSILLWSQFFPPFPVWQTRSVTCPARTSKTFCGNQNADFQVYENTKGPQ